MGVHILNEYEGDKWDEWVQQPNGCSHLHTSIKLLTTKHFEIKSALYMLKHSIKAYQSNYVKDKKNEESIK